MSNKRFGAVILAAGFSSRMGAFKPLLTLDDESILSRLVKTAKQAGVQDVVVVTGHNREALEPVLREHGALEAFNSRFQEGMFTSIQTGAEALPDGLDGFFLMPVDCPLVSAPILEKLKESFDSEKFSVACYRGRKGHPLLIPECFRSEIVEHDGTGGLKAITDRDFSLMQRIETAFEGVVMDMDTPQAYEKIKDFVKGGCQSDDLLQLAQGRRFILIRHGQIQQHKEKIFLGQTDVPLSEAGRIQAEEAGKQLASMQFETDRIYTSDLLRASQTAEIVNGEAGIGGVVPTRGLCEMNLGPWDGKFISEIKETMPEEYEKRGQNLMVYKMGHGSENFFDLQYRVIKTLNEILKQDPSKDIIITAHSGVLRAICNNLQGKDISESWDKMNNGEVRIVIA